MCLLLGIPRALAMVSVSKEGSRAIKAPWIPLPWRLSANSYRAQHMQTRWRLVMVGVDPLKTLFFMFFGCFYKHSSLLLPVFFQQRCNQNNKAIFGSIVEITLSGICLWSALSKGYCKRLRTHLQVYVSNPLHYSVTGPNNWVWVLELTLCPPYLQSLWKQKTQDWLDQHLQYVA